MIRKDKRIFKLISKDLQVDHYAPQYDIYIPAISEDGKIELKQIEEFTVHKKTPTMIVYHNVQHKEFSSFYVTEDHSLLVYDEELNKVYPVKPYDLKKLKKSEKKDKLFFIKLKEAIKSLDDEFDINDSSKCKLIPIKEIAIVSDGIQDTYDFTVKDYKTFATSEGLFVQDTMAVYMPLTVEGQKEAKEKMFRKARSVATGGLLFELAQGMILGLYLLTVDKKPKKQVAFSPKSLDYDYLYKVIKENPDLAYVDVVYSGPKVEKPIRTTLGRVLVNQLIPKQVPFFDRTLNKKNIKALFAYFNKYLTDDEILETYDKLRKLGFEFASRFAISFPITEMKIPLDLKKLVEKLKDMDPDSGNKYIKDVLTPKLIEYVKKNYPQVYAIFDSGSRGSWSDLVQMVLVKGYVEDAEGKVVKVPVTKGFIDNLNAVEAFIISPAARRGIANRSMKTAEGGYLTRRLVKAAANIKIDFNLNDCGTDEYLTIHVKDKDWAQALIGRWTSDDILITEDNYEEFVGQTIKIRSPIFCKSPKICKKCYGELWKLLTSDNIGIESAQIVGERGTQLIMKTFHTGGLAETKGIPTVVDTSNPDIEQKGDKIIVKKNCKVIINKDDCDVNIQEDRVLLREGIATIEFEDGTYTEVDVQDPSVAVQFINFIDFKAKDPYVVLTYESGQVIGDVELMSASFGSVLEEANRLFERRICKECSVEETLTKIYDLYKSTGRKLVHFEIILSNMTRAKSNLYVPYRLSNDKEYTIIGISQVPFYTSPLLALAFQNIGKAIETGLMFDSKVELPESDFEKILLGEFVKKE